jgi:hypothetical protein
MRSPTAKDTAAPPLLVNVTAPPVEMLIAPTLAPFFWIVYAAVAAGFTPTVPALPAKFAANEMLRVTLRMNTVAPAAGFPT